MQVFYTCYTFENTIDYNKFCLIYVYTFEEDEICLKYFVHNFNYMLYKYVVIVINEIKIILSKRKCVLIASCGVLTSFLLCKQIYNDFLQISPADAGQIFLPIVRTFLLKEKFSFLSSFIL